MKVYAAIDLLKGRMVRLWKGRVTNVKVYSDDPTGAATFWSEQGTSGLHIVDLDGAFGQGNNLQIIQHIIRSVHTPVQVGGGIRTVEVAHKLTEAGVDALVIGTVALADEATFRQILEIVDNSRIIVAVDYTDDSVLLKGWNERSGMKLDHALRHLIRMGLQNFLLTCSDRDGTMNGPDVDTIQSVCQRYRGTRIFASGGVRSRQDVAALRDSGAHAVIIGKALLEGTLSISEAVSVAGG